MTNPSQESRDEHTAGPWWVDDRRYEVGGVKSLSGLQVNAQHRGEGSSYCVASINGWEAPEANARLIAAAPDLLEAAREGLIIAEADVAEHERQLRDEGEDLDADSILAVFRKRRDLIRAAIARATSEREG